MEINPVNKYNFQNRKQSLKNPSFGNAYVTLAEKNLGRSIAKISEKFNAGELSRTYDDTAKMIQRVINKVNSSLGIRNTGKIKTVGDLTNEVDLFILAAGSGSRFRPLASEVASLRGKGEQFNKISIPFELGEGKEPFTMLEWALAMGKCFTGKKGYENIISQKPLGSFADIVMHYLSQKPAQRKVKDIVVLCGDNIFGNSSEEMLEYIVRTLNSGKQLGVVGVARKPQEVAGRFGVLDIGSFDPKTKLYSLNGFVEKPPIEVAQKMTNKEGNNAANTGMFVMSRESLEKLLKIIKEEMGVLGGKTKYIAKSATEPFDFAEATKWVQWLNGPEKCDVKIINRWEDVGEPQAYFRWLNELKDGEYLRNFSDVRKTEILSGLKNRVGRDTDCNRFIQFTPNPTSKTTGNVDGIKVMA